MIRLWLSGLLRRRATRVLATASGVLLAVALIGSMGSFLSSSERTMTSRATAGVAVDWQVAVRPGAAGGSAGVLRALHSEPGNGPALPVGFVRSPGFAATAGTTQTTGSGMVLGIPPSYARTFPGEVRVLSGSLDGAVVAQQTAANLQVRPGDSVTVRRPGMPPFRVRIVGVVELPQADSLFQAVGAPPQSQPVAPPDNVLLLPSHTFDQQFGPLRAARPDLVTTQIHVRRTADLPQSPSSAFTTESGQARHFEALTSGAAIVGDNLGATLDAAREDAAYARVLFLFLAAPGAALAAILTAAVAQSGASRRQHEHRLLRARGASTTQVLRLLTAEGLLVGVIGGIGGAIVALAVGRLAFGSARFGATSGASAAWLGAAVATGLLVTAATVIAPARRELVDRPTGRGPRAAPRWTRWGLDLVLVLAALGVFWAAGRNKYTLVLAPEGVPTLSVSYWAFLAPALAWLGGALLAWRLTDLLLGRGRGLTRRALRPLQGNLAWTGASMLARQRRVVVRAGVVLGLALAFAFSTATFNSTYRQQAEADAQLTNGADVTVTQSPGHPVGPAYARTLARIPGVHSVASMQHRFAYVGADLQDLYGIDARTFGTATTLQDPYFQGATAGQTMARLAARPDGVLVSAETVNDYQLNPGDQLRLRLIDSRTQRLTTVVFHYIGIVNEFPTAPKDSFLVANSSYVAQQTGTAAIGTFLLDTGGNNTHAVADRTRQVVGSNATISTLDQARGVVGSSLTSVDLAGLTKVELAFALLIAIASGALVMGIGLAERRQSVAVAIAIGATRRQLNRLAAGEPLFVALVGLVGGALGGWGMSVLLVKVLSGVFDPPPSSLAVPWSFLVATALSATATIAATTALVTWRIRRQGQQVLRDS